MNSQTKYSYDSSDDIVILVCKGIAWTLSGIAGLCAIIVLYGFLNNLISLAMA